MGSASAATSPINVIANFKETNGSSQQNLIKNLHMLSQSPAPRIATPNYLNIIPNGNGNVLRGANNFSIDNPGNDQSVQHISNLDLINGVESGSTIAALNRQMRLRGYGNSKNMVRHETKL